MSSAGPIATTKLPAWRLAHHAYLDVLGNLSGLMRVGGLWLLLSWALMMLGHSLPLLGTAADVAVALGAAAIAVAWHRRLLANDPLTTRMAPIDRRVIRYFGLSVMLAFLVGILPVVALFATMGMGEGEEFTPGLGILLAPALMIACVYVAMRLQLIFPATAIDDRAITPRSSWRITHGNGWRLVLGFFVTTLPVAIGVLALAFLLAWAAEATGSIALMALADLAAVANPWLQAPLIASFLSFAYLYFRQEAGEATTTS
jgi:hypothetical protein